MAHEGIVLTGPRGAGKTTLANELASDGEFVTVQAVTTRARRPDDPPSAYDYVSRRRFSALEGSGSLAVSTEYLGTRYGITLDALRNAARIGVPVLTLTPASTHQFLCSKLGRDYLGVFVDASDELLDARLTARNGVVREEDGQQRIVDRTFGSAPLQRIDNSSSLRAALSLVRQMFETEHAGPGDS